MMNEDFSSRGINEAISEGTRIIAEEAARCLEYQRSVQVLLTEAAGCANYDVLQEAALDSIKNMTVKFLARCEQVSRAVIVRLKEFGAKLSGRTEEYIRVIQPRVEAAKKHAGWESLRAEIYPWNPMYLESGISNGIRKLHMSWSTQVLAESMLEMIIREMRSHGDNAESYFSDLCDSLEYTISNIDNDTVEDASQAFGVSANDPDDLMEMIALKAHGGAREPGYVFGRDIDKIMATLLSSHKLVEGVRQTYEMHAKQLHDYANEVKSELAEAEEALMSGQVSNTDIAANAIKLSQQYIVKATEHYESLMGKANSMNISMIQQMCADYMRCVNMFVAYKGAQRTQQ